MVLVALDFDGALSQIDLSVLLGREYDVAGEIRGIVEQGLRGEVDFPTTLRHRVSLLEGMPEARVDRAFERCRLREGASDLVAALNRSAVSVAVITGSFERGVRSALDRAGISVDHLVANRLEMEEGAVTGEVEGPLMDGDKGAVLQELATVEGLSLDQTVAVGNGAMDLPMLKLAGTAIGVIPEPVVEQYCDVTVTSLGKLHLYFEQHGFIDES